MYTVIRFSDKTERNNLESLGEKLNRCLPGLFTGLDRVPNRFSCSVCSEDDWESHSRAISAVLTRCSEPIKEAISVQMELSIDVAIAREDYVDSMLTELVLDTKLTGLLSQCRTAFVVSIYGSKG